MFLIAQLLGHLDVESSSWWFKHGNPVLVGYQWAIFRGRYQLIQAENSLLSYYKMVLLAIHSGTTWDMAIPFCKQDATHVSFHCPIGNCRGSGWSCLAAKGLEVLVMKICSLRKNLILVVLIVKASDSWRTFAGFLGLQITSLKHVNHFTQIIWFPKATGRHGRWFPSGIGLSGPSKTLLHNEKREG